MALLIVDKWGSIRTHRDFMLYVYFLPCFTLQWTL